MCVTSWPTEHFSVKTLFLYLFLCLCHVALQLLPYFVRLGTIVLQIFRLCLFFLNLQTRLTMIWFNPWLRQQQFKWNFVLTILRNHTFSSDSSKPSSQRRVSNLKNSNMPMPSATCPSKSFETFWTHLMSATSQTSLYIFWKMFCLGSSERASGNLILNGKAGP